MNIMQPILRRPPSSQQVIYALVNSLLCRQRFPCLDYILFIGCVANGGGVIEIYSEGNGSLKLISGEYDFPILSGILFIGCVANGGGVIKIHSEDNGSLKLLSGEYDFPILSGILFIGCVAGGGGAIEIHFAKSKLLICGFIRILYLP